MGNGPQPQNEVTNQDAPSEEYGDAPHHTGANEFNVMLAGKLERERSGDIATASLPADMRPKDS